MYSYHAYGLCIASALVLPELELQDGHPDVIIDFGSIRRPFGATALSAGIDWCATPEEIYLFDPAAGAVLVRHGREILCDPISLEDCSALQQYVLGPGLAFLLHQRGLLVLHASGVRVGTVAVIFMGDTGSGKSTTAGAMQNMGHSVIADDIAPVIVGEHQPSICAENRRLRLWTDAMRALGGEPETSPEMLTAGHKMLRPAERIDLGAPVPLKRVYVLNDGMGTPVSERLPRQEAFMEIVRYTYVINIVRTTGGTETHLRQCAELASKVPVHRLTRKRAFTDLENLARFIEKDLR